MVNKPKSEVFEYIKYLKNQNSYSKWSLIDPSMKKTYKGTDGNVGFISAWESNDENLGSGEQEITKLSDGERIDYELRFLKPFKVTNQTYMIVSNINGDQTIAKWGFNGYMNYPMNVIMLFVDFEKKIGDDLQTGLNNLKAILEK